MMKSSVDKIEKAINSPVDVEAVLKLESKGKKKARKLNIKSVVLRNTSGKFDSNQLKLIFGNSFD